MLGFLCTHLFLSTLSLSVKVLLHSVAPVYTSFVKFCKVLAMARLNRIWRCNAINAINKFKLYKSLLTSILFYGYETWTLLSDSEQEKKKKDSGFRNQVHDETSQ